MQIAEKPMTGIMNGASQTRIRSNIARPFLYILRVAPCVDLCQALLVTEVKVSGIAQMIPNPCRQPYIALHHSRDRLPFSVLLL